MPGRMEGQAAQVQKLSHLMREALDLSLKLQKLTEESLIGLETEYDEAIFAAIKERERILTPLISLEREVSLLLDAVGENAMPPEAERLRREIRLALSRVSEIDNRAMPALGDKMQTYRDRALAARNKKLLSAYIKPGPDLPSAHGRGYNKFC